jgi:hypothetical protein
VRQSGVLQVGDDLFDDRLTSVAGLSCSIDSGESVKIAW